MNIKRQKGMTLIEVIIGATIIGTSFIFIIGAYSGLSKLSYRNTARVQAAMLAEEGIEALRSMRDAGWTSNIASLAYDGAVYRLAWTGTAWRATTSAALIDGQFDRTFILSPVYRDGSFNVVTSGGSPDTSSRKVVVTVSWRDDNATSSKSVDGYIFNTFGN